MDLKVVGIVGSPRRGCQGLGSGLHIIQSEKSELGLKDGKIQL